MGNIQSFHFSSSDGVHQCYVRQWLPQGDPRAVVQIAHGVTEHIGRYDQVARFLAHHGFLVCGEDHLGHGRTALPGEHGCFPDKNGWALVTEDVLQLRRIQGKKYPGIPYFLLGHSMGSFLVRTFLCRYPGQVDGAILSGTGQEPAPLVAAGKAAAGLLSALWGNNYVSLLVYKLSLGTYNDHFKPTRTRADWLSRDQEAVDAFLADPLCSARPSCGLFQNMLEGLQYIASPKALAQMDPNTPVYIFSGDQDPVGSMGKGVRIVHGYFKDHGTRDLELKLYPDGRHEMFNELNRQQVYEDLLAWLEKHI